MEREVGLGNSMKNKKVVVVGAGPGGYVSAIRAAQLGAEVKVVEKDSPGGVCLNAGCIPTKALIASIELLANIERADEFGIKVSGVEADFSKMVERKDKIVKQLAGGVRFLFKKNGIELVKGKAAKIEPGRVNILTEDGDEKELSAEDIIIATGSSPSKPAVFKFDGDKIITSEEALRLRQVPEKLLVIGGGAIGLEFAYIFSVLGSDVSVVEEMEHLLPGEDAEISGILEQSLIKKKIKVYTGVRVDSVEKEKVGITARLSSGDSIQSDKALIAVGRIPNTEGLGLEEMNLLNEKGYITVNNEMRTAVPGIYAVGDVVGGMLLAHKASAEGIVAAENIAGAAKKMEYRAVPRCIFTKPEVAAVGISEKDAMESGEEIKTGRFPFSALGKAMAGGDTEGMVKIVTDGASGEILGVHIIGPHASDLIAEAALAMSMEAAAEDIAGTIHAHPTFSEAIMEAGHSVEGKAIHI